jgi:MraZ protein
MINLIGSYEVKADAKGRVMIPADLKKQVQPILNEGFILKRSIFQKCLELYPMSEWNKEAESLTKLNRFVKENNDFIRAFMAGVRNIDLDNAGRIQIPRDLVNYAGLKKNLVISSSINRMEIWDKETYESELNNPEVDFGVLAEKVMGNKPHDNE